MRKHALVFLAALLAVCLGAGSALGADGDITLTITGATSATGGIAASGSSMAVVPGTSSGKATITVSNVQSTSLATAVTNAAPTTTLLNSSAAVVLTLAQGATKLEFASSGTDDANTKLNNVVTEKADDTFANTDATTLASGLTLVDGAKAYYIGVQSGATANKVYYVKVTTEAAAPPRHHRHERGRQADVLQRERR